jgi:hypothetical protein
VSEYRVGIVPAAGKATRFGGTLKELLPIGPGMSLMKYAVLGLEQTCDEIVVITSPQKWQAHAYELSYTVFYTFQSEDKDIWGAMREGLRFRADRYFFIMPDTLIRHQFPGNIKANFLIGTFETMRPDRFGCFSDDCQYVINKSLFVKKPARAWGTLVWSDAVAAWWLTQDIEDYTQAINMAIDKFGYETYELESYTDFASFEDYKNFLKGEPNEPISY